MADDSARLGGGTSTYEAFLERKREALRKALRQEFIRQRYNPNFLPDGNGHLFDAAIQRWQAMQFTQGEFFYPTFRNFCYFAGAIIVPFTCLITFSITRRSKEAGRYARGEVAYDAPERKSKWMI